MTLQVVFKSKTQIRSSEEVKRMKAVKLGILTKCTYVLPDHCMYKNRTMMKAAVVLLPLLGLTWIFGLLAVNEHLSVFIWLFTVLNSLQVSLACLYSYKRVYCFLNRVYSYLSSTWSDMKRYIITLVHSIIYKANETLFVTRFEKSRLPRTQQQDTLFTIKR